jgi:hypothetical protein
MINRSHLRKLVKDLHKQRSEALAKKHDFQAIGLRKAIDEVNNLIRASECSSQNG